MASNNYNPKLPVQTKIVFSFIIVLAVALVSKWVYFSLQIENKKTEIESHFSGIKKQINEICLNEEVKNLKGSNDSNEDDQEWINLKAPEYCKCVSSRMLSFWNEKEKFDQIIKIKSEELPGYIAGQLQNENTKSLIDYCLSKAQRISNRKSTASATKN